MDQKALRWLLEQKKLSPRQARWLEEFQGHNIMLEWIPGTMNTIADILSQWCFHEDVAIQVNALLNEEDMLDKI